MEEQRYKFVDITGKCFESFQMLENCEECFNERKCDDCGVRRYNDSVGALLRASNNDEHFFSVGDMMVFKQDLLDAGFKWGIDFCVKKIEG